MIAIFNFISDVTGNNHVQMALIIGFFLLLWQLIIKVNADVISRTKFNQFIG